MPGAINEENGEDSKNESGLKEGSGLKKESGLTEEPDPKEKGGKEREFANRSP